MNEFQYLAAIKDIIEHREGTEKLPEMAPIVAMYVANYRPAESDPTSYMTSVDIAKALSDIYILSPNEVAQVMLFLGYKTGLNDDGDPAWKMAACEID